MLDVKHCDGCKDDFYNGKNSLGVTQCWHLPKAKLVHRILIHVDQAPPYVNPKVEKVPDCYRRPRFIAVAPTSIRKDGYWA